MDESKKNQPDTNPVQDKQSGELLEELRSLGENLRTLLRSAWESEERKKLQQEIEIGLGDLHTSLSQAVQEFSDSPTGQTLKSDLDDLNERLRTGEVENKIRTEVISALRAANEGLKNAVQKEPAAKAEKEN
jgi:signal recognition particle GTPase